MATRTTVRLRSQPVLKESIRLKKMSIRYFADEVSKRGAPCSPGMITHLLAGRKETCSAKLGRAIEEALGLPEGLLFEPTKSTKAGRSVDDSEAAA